MTTPMPPEGCLGYYDSEGDWLCVDCLAASAPQDCRLLKPIPLRRRFPRRGAEPMTKGEMK